VSEPLGFVLRLEQGRGALGLARTCAAPFGRIEQLVLELPDLRYPFDLSEGVGRFRDRRTRLRTLRLSLGSEDLLRLLDRPGLAGVGLHLLGLEIVDEGEVRLALQARLAGASAGTAAVPVTVRAWLVAAPGGRLRVELDVPRVFGELPVAAPLLVSAWWAAAAPGWVTHAPPLLVRRGLLACEVAARELALFALLPAHGWRLPEREAVELAEVAVAAGRLVLEFQRRDQDSDGDGAGAGGGARLEDAGGAGGRLAQLLADGDQALAAGGLRAAEECYRQAVELAPDARSAGDRLLAVLAVAPAADGALDREIAAQLARDPTAVAPLLALASLAARRGRAGEAVAAYERVADLCQAAGESVDAASADVAAAALDRPAPASGAGH
jgi:cellulose synthase operon protein C